MLSRALTMPLPGPAIAQAIRPPQWLIDAGNSDHYGQILLGNTDNLHNAFHENEGVVYGLPLPTTQQPELLVSAPPRALDCAEEVQTRYQSPVINQAMAIMVLEVVRRLIEGTCTWMQVFVNLGEGTIRTVDATPENVAQIMKMTEQELTKRERR